MINFNVPPFTGNELKYIEQAVQNMDETQDNSVILEHAEKIKLKNIKE